MATYLFDFDGTLVDSMPTYVSFMLRILDENGIGYSDDIVKIITPLGYRGTAEYFGGLGLEMPIEDIVAKMTEYATHAYANEIGEKPNVISTVKALKARGDNLNVLTASPHNMLDPCLKRLGIYHLFTNVWSCEDFGTTKADPNIYRLAAERIGAPINEIIFIDDNYNADKTAKSAGMTFYGVYDASSAEFENDIKSVADRYIRDFSELVAP